MAGCCSHCAGQAGQPRLGRPLGAGHGALRDTGPAGGRPNRLQQEDCQGYAGGRNQPGIFVIASLSFLLITFNETRLLKDPIMTYP